MEQQADDHRNPYFFKEALGSLYSIEQKPIKILEDLSYFHKSKADSQTA
jgi:hypothetical protein